MVKPTAQVSVRRDARTYRYMCPGKGFTSLVVDGEAVRLLLVLPPLHDGRCRMTHPLKLLREMTMLVSKLLSTDQLQRSSSVRDDRGEAANIQPAQHKHAAHSIHNTLAISRRFYNPRAWLITSQPSRLACAAVHSTAAFSGARHACKQDGYPITQPCSVEARSRGDST